jgi:uncharacterized protein YxjI
MTSYNNLSKRIKKLEDRFIVNPRHRFVLVEYEINDNKKKTNFCIDGKEYCIPRENKITDFVKENFSLSENCLLVVLPKKRIIQ